MSVSVQACRRLTCAAKATHYSFKEKELVSLGKLNSSAKKLFQGSISAHLPSSSSLQFSGRRIVVLMVGWAESRQSTLAKYAAIYTHMGLPCVTVAASITSMWYAKLGNRLADVMLESLDSSLESPTDVLVHIFSGGGTAVFPRLLLEYDKPDSLFRSKLFPAGVVFDSGPAIFSQESGLAAANLVYKQGGYNFFTYCLSSMVGVLINLAIGSRKRLELQRTLDHPHFLSLPQLYLHSNIDKISPPWRVKEIIDGQKEKGRDVRSYCWTDTIHVRHFTQHPEQYTKKINEFMTDVIAT